MYCTVQSEQLQYGSFEFKAFRAVACEPTKTGSPRFHKQLIGAKRFSFFSLDHAQIANLPECGLTSHMVTGSSMAKETRAVFFFWFTVMLFLADNVNSTAGWCTCALLKKRNSKVARYENCIRNENRIER